MFETVRLQIVMPGSWRVMEPDEKLEITLQDGTVLHGRVIDASPPSDDGSVTYAVSWEAGA